MTLEAIHGECMRKMMSAMSMTLADVGAMVPDMMQSYYTGSPIVYERTGQLAGQGRVEGVFGGGDSCGMAAYIDQGFSYPNGNYNSGAEVTEATNEGLRNVCGTTGYWDRAEEYAKIIADSHFGAMFG